jgi:hypothetical protein
MDTLHTHVDGQFSLIHPSKICRSRRLLLVETTGRESEGMTELMAGLALHGPFHVIPAGEWLPGYALTRSLRRRTRAVKQILAGVRVARPFTCYQLLDLLENARPEGEPLLILDFLHHFHNEDVELPVRQRVLEQCCRHLQRLSLFRPVVVFVQRLAVDEYQGFLSIPMAMADEVFQLDGTGAVEASQPALF